MKLSELKQLTDLVVASSLIETNLETMAKIFIKINNAKGQRAVNNLGLHLDVLNMEIANLEYIGKAGYFSITKNRHESDKINLKKKK